MELLLDVPSFLHPFLQWMVQWVEAMHTFWHMRIHEPWDYALAEVEHWRDNLSLWWTTTSSGNKSDDSASGSVFLPILAVLLVFWPVVLSLVMSIMAAGTWIIWLVTSIILGIVQLIYATYHFAMIAVDIGGLSLLKTYAMLRSQVLYYMEIWTSSSNNLLSSDTTKTPAITAQQPQLQSSKSRRRQWRQNLELAGTYENFLKIRVAPKDERKMNFHRNAVDSALPPVSPTTRIVRTTSFPDRSHVEKPTAAPHNSSLSPKSTPVRRRRSSSAALGRSSSMGDEVSEARSSDSPTTTTTTTTSVEVDPRVVEELGEKTANLLITTTERLEEAHRAVQERPTEENAKALKYLLSAVVKRNHLTLEDIVVQNARSIAVTGQYGLTSETRQVIRAYYEQVEQGLDWLSEAPAIEATGSIRSPQEQQTDPLHERPPPRPNEELVDRMLLVRKMKQNMGRTALMLSGGGAQAMYHGGLLRALIESKLYKDITVVSGTSGGSIMAAVSAGTFGVSLYRRRHVDA